MVLEADGWQQGSGERTTTQTGTESLGQAGLEHLDGVASATSATCNLSTLITLSTGGRLREAWWEVSVGEQSQNVNLQEEEAAVASLAMYWSIL